MWIKKAGWSQTQDFAKLLEEVHTRTHLPIALDGIYKWIVFLPSRQNTKVPVANRYFGVFQSGEIKMRGIETRRHDTPLFVSKAQMEMLAELAKDADWVRVLPGLRVLLREKICSIRDRAIHLHEFVIRQTLSRTSDQYRGSSSVAEALRQLEAAGKSLRPGQTVRFVYTRGRPRVRAWDLPSTPNPLSLDTRRYVDLLLRAAETVLTPLGMSGKELEEWLFENVRSVPLLLEGYSRST
jgi:DNA polymerase-2